MVPRFSAGQFSVVLEDGSTITETTLPSSQLNIHVFNQRFVHENIDWDKSVKSILLIAKEKIDDLQKLEKLKGELQSKKKAHDEKQSDMSLSGILCVRHTMTNRSMYANQEEVGAGVAGDPARTH